MTGIGTRRRARLATLTMLLASAATSAVPAAAAPKHGKPKPGMVYSTTSNVPGEGPPPARVDAVTDTYFGKSVTDPYRWMETPSDELTGWVKGENAYTQKVLARIPGRDGLRKHLNEISGGLTLVTSASPAGHRLFFLRRAPGDDLAKLVMHDADAGQDRVVFDPNAAAANGYHYSIDQFQPSQDGRYVAVGLSDSGSEEDVLHVFDAESGRELPDAIDRARFASASWLPDGSSFYYNRLRAFGPHEPAAARFDYQKVFVHHLGTDPDKDIPVFGAAVGDVKDIAPSHFVQVVALPGTRYALGIDNDGVSPESTLYLSKLPESGDTGYAWRKIATAADGVVDVTSNRDHLFYRTHKGAPRYRVISVPLADPDIQAAKEIVPQGAGVITNIAASSEALYIAVRTGAASGVTRIGNDGKSAELKLPVTGAIDAGALVADPRAPGAVVGIGTWVSPTAWYTIGGGDSHELTDMALVPPAPGAADYVVTETTALAKDGRTKIPLSIIEKKGTPHDKAQPVLVEGYGAYGISIEPSASMVTLVRGWVDAGGVFAVAHVRGGGELGEDWHLAGKIATKQNTIHDFIDCAWAMTKLGYATPNTLAGTGTSAGGITIGGAMTQMPSLFRAALVRVGATNTLREETTEGGPANVPEFGTTANKDDFPAMLAMDAYQHIKPGVMYPATMVTAGAQDHRVPMWESAKFAARLQAAGKNKGPVLLRVDTDAGHGGIGLGAAQQNAEYADDFAFLLWQLGAPGFQPAP